MIEVLADEKKLIDAEFGANILSNLINSIPKDDKKKDEKKEEKKDEKKEKKKIDWAPINVNKYPPSGAKMCPNLDWNEFIKNYKDVSVSYKAEATATN